MDRDDDCNLKYNLYVHWEAKNVYDSLFRDIDFIAVVWNQKRLSIMPIFLL